MPEDKDPEVVTPGESAQRRQRAAAREALAAERDMPIDEAPPGGRYMVDGVLVDCDGKPVKGS